MHQTRKGKQWYFGMKLPALKQLATSTAAPCCCAVFQRPVSRPACGLDGRSQSPLDRLRQAKEAADLHSDQLSQAVLLEFAESGRLEAHRRRLLEGGRERLQDPRSLP